MQKFRIIVPKYMRILFRMDSKPKCILSKKGKRHTSVELKNLIKTLKQLKYHLQNQAYSQIHSTYTSKILKSTLYIQKSTQKQSKILYKYSSHLLFSMYIKLFTLNIHTKFSQSNI